MNNILTLKRERLQNIKGVSLRGFTIVEIIIVIIIVGIIAVVTVINMPDMLGMRIMDAAYKIQSDIRYVQRLAMNTQRYAKISFNMANDSYTAYIQDTYGGIDWILIQDPLTHEEFIVQLNSGEFEGVDITAVYFNNYDRDLVFDEYGVPYSYDGIVFSLLNSNPWAGIRLNNVKEVRVTQKTGRVNIQDAP